MALNIPIWPPPQNPPWPGAAGANPYEAIRFGARGNVPEGFVGGGTPSAPTRPISTPSLGPAAQPMGELMPGPTPEQAAAQARLDAAARGTAGDGRVFTGQPPRGVGPGGRVVTQTPPAPSVTPRPVQGPVDPRVSSMSGWSMPEGATARYAANTIPRPGSVPLSSAPGASPPPSAPSAGLHGPFQNQLSAGPNAPMHGPQRPSAMSRLKPQGWRGYAGRIKNTALGPVAGGLALGTVGEMTDNDPLRAAGQATLYGGSAATLAGAPALPATVVPAAGVGIGAATAVPFTGGAASVAQGDSPLEGFDASSPTDWMSAPANLVGGFAGALAMPAAASGIPVVSDLAGRVVEGERGIGDIQIGDWRLGELWGDDGGRAEAEAMAAQQQARELQLARAEPAAMRNTLMRFGLPGEVADQQLARVEESIDYAAEMSERGLGPMIYEGAFVDRDPESGQYVDAEGNPIDPSKLSVPSRDDLRVAMMDELLLSVPELQANEQARQDQLNRAAAFQAVVGQYMEPYLNRSQEISDLYAASGQPGMAAANLAAMQAQEGYIRLIPQMQAADQTASLQAQLEQMYLQEQLRPLREELQGEEESTDEDLIDPG